MSSENIISTSSKKMPRHERYTGVRIEQYQTLKASRSNMTRTAYRSAVQSLDTKQRKANREKAKRDQAREQREQQAEIARQQAEAQKELERQAKKEQQRVARNQRRREQRQQKKAEQEGLVLDLNGPPTLDADEWELNVKPAIVNSLGKLDTQRSVYLQLAINGEIVKTKLVKDYKGGDRDAFYYNVIWDFIFEYVNGEIINRLRQVNENGNVVDLEPTDRVRFVIMKSADIPSEATQQRYRDGVTHCVLEPLFRLYQKMTENAQSPASKKRLRQITNRIKKLEQTYPDGVPEGLDMEAVARVVHRCIVIHDILGNEVRRYNPASPKYFRFTNTRLNHLEQGKLAWDGEYENITQERMDEIVYEHDKDDVFYLYGGDVNCKSSQELGENNCRSLRSVRGAYAVFNEDYEIFKEFNKSLDIPSYGIDAVKYEDLNNFVKESRIINSAPTPLCDEPNNLEDAQHIDIEKAYTQHEKCGFYKGFLGHITAWGKVPANPIFLKTHTGIFQFSVVHCPNELLTKLGISEGNTYTLPSPEIEYFMTLGVEVQLIAGCWGSTFDIEYTPIMLEKRRYCIWAGKLGMDNDCNTYTFKGDAGWAGCLKQMLGNDQVYFFNSCSMIVVKIPKKSYYTKHHILSFITSYCRINMLQTMGSIDGELIKVVLDGIYFRGELPDMKLPHSTDKKLVQHIGFKDAWYYPSTISTIHWDTYDDRFDVPADKIPNVCVLTGAGGTGKSHSVLQNPALTDVLYVVPTHALGRKMRTKTGCKYTTIHKLIGIRTNEKGEEEKSRSYQEEHGVPSAIFIDEITMIEASWIERAIKLYPNSKLFIAGDVDTKQWFQCRNGYTGNFSKVWMPSTDYHIIPYTTDYRAKDDRLKQLKTDLREVMKNVFTDGGQTDAIRMKVYLKSRIQTTKFDDAVKKFKTGDIWIAGTHKTNQKLLEAGVVSGFINKHKEIVATEEAGAEKRGCFTTHSFQGFTLETEKVFISLDFFEYAMLYTSISRVCNFHQLVIVE
jgi:hypothetical protein